MSNRHLALFISLLLVSFFGGCTATPPSGPAFPHQLIQSGSMTVPYNSSVSWMVPFPTGNKAINPLQSSMVGLDTRISWHHNMTANSCFNLTTTVGIARANGVPVGNTLTLYSKVLCLQPDSAQLLDAASPVSPCQLNQLVEASQDITGIQLQLTMSIQKPSNPALPYEPLSITTNASVVFASTQITNQWQWDSNVLCQSVRYYMAHSKMRTNPVFSITNESSPSVGLGSVGGCLPDNLGHVIATYSGGKVTQSGTVLHWKATNVPKGTLSLSVEVNGANGAPTTVCSMYAKIDLKTSDDQHDTRVVLAVTFSLVGAAIIFVAVIVLIGKYRAKKAADYTQIP